MKIAVLINLDNEVVAVTSMKPYNKTVPEFVVHQNREVFIAAAAPSGKNSPIVEAQRKALEAAKYEGPVQPHYYKQALGANVEVSEMVMLGKVC